MSNKKLTVLFCPLDAYGHVNPCIGVGEQLRDRGHRVIFAIDSSWKGRLEKYGFQEELINDPSKNEENKDSQKNSVNMLKQFGLLSPKSAIEKLRPMMGGMGHMI